VGEDVRDGGNPDPDEGVQQRRDGVHREPPGPLQQDAARPDAEDDTDDTHHEQAVLARDPLTGRPEALPVDPRQVPPPERPDRNESEQQPGHQRTQLDDGRPAVGVGRAVVAQVGAPDPVDERFGHELGFDLALALLDAVDGMS